MNEYIFILLRQVFNWYNHTCQLWQISTYGNEATITKTLRSSRESFRSISQVWDCQSSSLFAASNKSYTSANERQNLATQLHTIAVTFHTTPTTAKRTILHLITTKSWRDCIESALIIYGKSKFDIPNSCLWTKAQPNAVRVWIKH